MEANGACGIVGSKLMEYSKPEEVQSAGVHTVLPFLCLLLKKSFSSSSKVPLWVWAASLPIKRDCLKDIGSFDENYFYSEEDKDLCIRARKKGWQISCSEESIVYHKGGSGKVKPDIRHFLGKEIIRSPYNHFRLRGYYEVRNELYCLKKHYPFCFVFSLLGKFGLIISILILDKKTGIICLNL
jgi:GT2 family glycosyltransferase